jgi:hypothetical protein
MGVRLINMDADDKLQAIARVIDEDEDGDDSPANESGESPAGSDEPGANPEPVSEQE